MRCGWQAVKLPRARIGFIFPRPSHSIVFLSGGFKAIQKDVNVTRHSPKNRASNEILKHPGNHHHLPHKQISENTPLLKGNKGWQFLKLMLFFMIPTRWALPVIHVIGL